MTELQKLPQESKDMTTDNIDKLATLFPNCITEVKDKDGIIKKSINFDVLKQMMSSDLIEDSERYEFTWPGKNAAILEANTPIRKTLRPCVEESKDWNNTQNMYIEGDNLEALKLLQESYLNKIKVIYIDPPYNTGNDILYKNNYYTSESDYNDSIELDEDNNRLFVNTESNGRFHSDWCSMMYQRILLAKNLLSKDGFFCIAIDHNELFNIGEICDEIFGYKNRIAIISVVHKPEGRNQAKYIGPSNEFMLMYIKDDQLAKIRQVALDEEQIELFNNTDENGQKYRLKNFIRLADGKYSLRENKPDFWYPIYVSKDLSTIKENEFEDSITVYPITDTGIERTWKTSRETFIQRNNNNDFVAKNENGHIKVFEKLKESQVIKTHWINKKYHGFHFGTKLLDDLLGVKTFDFPKSLYLMHDIFKLLTDKDDIILDFFSGSATSAHAIMQLNSEDLQKRRFIMVQLPVEIDKKTDAYNAGFKTICDIGKTRITKAAEKIKNENTLISNKLDLGFRVFKVSDSNMKDVFYNPDALSQDLLSTLESNIKDDRTDLDLLFGCLLDFGLTLDKPIKEELFEDKKILIYNDDTEEGADLIACFEDNISEDLIKEIAKRKPSKAVFKDSSFANSPVKINLFEIFKLYAEIDADELPFRVKVI